MSADYTKEVPERYRINFNRLQGAFYILDMWHETVKNLPDGADVPIDSPAMKIISALEVNALLGVLKDMGWLDKIVGLDKIGGPGESISYSKTLQETSIENITAIVQAAKDESVAKEAISAIRDIVTKI
jgi:hypothetical protein